MSVSCNGSNSVYICEATGDIRSYSPYEPSPKTGFRGFHKLPAVVVPRIDIGPYLKPSNLPKNDPVKINGTVAKKSVNGLKKSSLKLDEKFFMKCDVKVDKFDLGGLNESLNNGSLDLNDINMVKCKICEKEYPNEKKLNNHQENKHVIVYQPEPTKCQKRVSFSDKVIVHELREYHRCRKCTKIFDDYKSLKVHMKHWHKKRKCYICHYCFKKFVDRMFFKVHIKLHCEVCGLLLQSKKKYFQHKRSVCRNLKRHKCEECGLVFFSIMSLKDHSYDHRNAACVCDVCKDQCPTKCGIAHHIKFLHSKRRPESLYTVRNLGNERLYLCNFCDETSVDRDVIENHVELLPDLKNRVMTGYKDYYFCDQCMKKFQTESDMLKHKWTHYLKPASLQLRPKGILTNSSKVENEIKRFYKVDELIPTSFQPKVLVEKMLITEEEDDTTVDDTAEVDATRQDNLTPDNVTTQENGTKEADVTMHDIVDSSVSPTDVGLTNAKELKKPVVDPKSKKTLLSKHQCQTCEKYFSTNYCLNRHIETQHSDYDNLKCKVCEEVFVWPSLLKSHKCIRLNHPEMPFEDARPEIHFDNLQEFTSNGFDDLNIADDENYINSVDFDIPAPVIALQGNPNSFAERNHSVTVPRSQPIQQSHQRYPDNLVSDNFVSSTVNTDELPVVSPILSPLGYVSSTVTTNEVALVTPSGYKVVMQEVPIEF